MKAYVQMANMTGKYQVSRGQSRSQNASPMLIITEITKATMQNSAIRTILLSLLLCVGASAQAVRFDLVVQTTNASCVSGKICPLSVIPGARVQVCSPNTPTCTGAATTYVDTTAGTPCPSNAQLTGATGGACTASSDKQGNAGFWILPGTYSYFVTLPTTAGGTTSGPYSISVGGSAGCPLGAFCDANYASLPLAMTAAGNASLYITRTWPGLTTATYTTKFVFLGNGKFQPANGQTVTMKVQGAPLSQICDISQGGNCAINAANGLVFPEYWGAVAGSDSTLAWQAMLNTVSSTNNSMAIHVVNNNGLCYNIATTLTHTGNNLQSLTIEGTLLNGQATGASCLQWIGAAAGTLMTLTNEVGPVIRNMEFKGNALAKTDVLFQSDGSNFNVFSLVIDHSSFAGMIGAGSAGLQLDSLPCTNPNVSGITIRDSVFAGNSSGIDTGILSPCGGNSKNITIEGGASRFTNLGTGIDYFGGNDGYVLISGVYFGVNSVRDINVAVGNVIVQSTDSEGSAQMAQIGAGTNHCSLQVRGAAWAGITDVNDRVISSTGCSLEITGSQFNNGRTPGVTLPKITLNAGLQPNCAPFCGGPALVSHNNFFLNADATHGAYYDSGGNAICVPYGGYFSINNQAAAQCTGDYGGANNFTQVKLPDYSPLAPRLFTPASAVATCSPPEIAYDANFVYACTAANTWFSVPKSPTFGASNFVTTDTAQNITASKVFTVDQTFSGLIHFPGPGPGGSINGVGIAAGIEFLDSGGLRTFYVSPTGSPQFAKPAGVVGSCAAQPTGTVSKQVVGAVNNVLVLCP